jgi:hypothetical protein
MKVEAMYQDIKKQYQPFACSITRRDTFLIRGDHLFIQDQKSFYYFGTVERFIRHYCPMP